MKIDLSAPSWQKVRIRRRFQGKNRDGEKFLDRALLFYADF